MTQRSHLNVSLKRGFNWCGSEECQSSYYELKWVLTSGLMLMHYEPRPSITVAADASKRRTKAMLLHKFLDGTQKTTFHGFRTPAKAERHQIQIQKKVLAVVFINSKSHKILHIKVLRCALITTHYQPYLGRKRHTLFAPKIACNVE